MNNKVELLAGDLCEISSTRGISFYFYEQSINALFHDKTFKEKEWIKGPIVAMVVEPNIVCYYDLIYHKIFYNKEISYVWATAIKMNKL